jgi:hypothetical protein
MEAKTGAMEAKTGDMEAYSGAWRLTLEPRRHILELWRLILKPRG